jgi:hypothetical protein
MKTKQLTHDEKVIRRWGIIEAIEEATSTRDRELLKQVLRRIHKTPDFEVVMDCQEEIYIHGQRYGLGDKSIMIKESGHRMFVIYKNKDDGKIWLDYSPYDVQTEAEDKAEAEWEQEAENAHEKYYDYKASFDDPRGY